MTKTFVGPQLRQLRRERRQTQAEMAKVLGVSSGYVNLLENNGRSLSLRVLMTLADNYGVDWRDIVADKTPKLLAELRSVIKDPMFSATAPDLTELRAAIDHAPRLVAQFLHLYGIHRNTLERLMRQGTSATTDRLLATSAEAVVHDFFRDNSNYFQDLETAAQALRSMEASESDDIYATLKARLFNAHGIRIKRRTIEEMTQALRVYDKENRVIYLSEALDHSNVIFQIAHVLCLTPRSTRGRVSLVVMSNWRTTSPRHFSCLTSHSCAKRSR
jgi:transcriptional regulator with XRE-family HTH domain